MRHLALVAVLAAARPAGAGVHVLDDVVANGTRTTIVVVDDHGDCVDPARLKITGRVRTRTACVVEIVTGAADPISIVAPDGTHQLPAPRVPAPLEPPTLVPDLEAEVQLAVRTIPSLRVGTQVVAATIVAYVRGRPSSNIELRLSSTTAKLRGMTWLAPGRAEVQLLVPAFAETVDLTITGEHDERRVEIPVAPGPPIVVEARPSASVVAGEVFPIAPRVSTVGGTPIDPGAVTVVPPRGCAAAPGGFRCAPGVQPFVIQVQTADGRLPIDHVAVDVAEPPPGPAPPPPSRAWEVGARGVVDGWGAFGGGIDARVAATTGNRRWFEAGAAWTVRGDRFTGDARVDAGLRLVRQEIALGAGGAVRRGPIEARLALGPALAIDHGSVSSVMAGASYRGTTLGLTVWASAAIGVRLPVRGRVRLDVGGQVSREVVAAAWQRPAGAMFVEVSVGR